MTTTQYYQSIASNLQLPSKAFINGKFVDAIDGNKFENKNPATGELLNSVSQCNHKDVNLAAQAARSSFESGVWSKCAPEERKKVLLKFAELIRSKSDEMSVMESLDSGKTIADCLNEVGGEVPNFFQWYGELIDKVFGKVVPTRNEVTSLIIKEPIGVVGLVIPWNFPLLMAAWKAAPALAAGCSIILKPAEQTPLTCLMLAQLAQEAGFPDGVINVIPGLGDAGEAIGRHPDIDAVSFTGSTEVGRLFMRYSGESNLKTIGLEMGGKSPFIVLDDANINENLIESAVMSAFWNGGQNCSANMRQLVHEKIKDDYLHAISKKARSIKVGDPLDPTSQMGSMVSEEHLLRVNTYIQKGIEEGAQVIFGGTENPLGRGYFANPTLFDKLEENMVIAREEIFGPVLGVMTVKNMEDAVRIANDSQYGLHASVFTQDIGKAFHLSKSLKCGTVSVNSFSEGDIKTPFGGYKQSGSLSRDNGTEALDQYLQTKTIWINLD